MEWLGQNPSKIDIGAAGTAMRFSTALLAITEGTHVITGSQRMRQRPIGVLVDALRQLGADIKYVENKGFPPLEINGKAGMEGGEICLRGDVSSQYITALLMIAPYMTTGLTLTLQGQVISRPYIDMTLSIMRFFGADARWEGTNSVKVGKKPYVKKNFTVENDWSASSYWYEIASLCNSRCEILLDGLQPNSLQGDTCIRTLWNKMPVKREVVPESVAQLCGTDINGQEVFEGDVLIDDAYLFATKVGTCGCITASKNYGDGWFLLTLFINLLEEVMRQLNVEYHRNFRRMLIHEMQHYCIGQEKL